MPQQAPAKQAVWRREFRSSCLILWPAIAAAGHTATVQALPVFPSSVWCLSFRLSLVERVAPRKLAGLISSRNSSADMAAWRHFVLHSDWPSMALRVDHPKQ